MRIEKKTPPPNTAGTAPTPTTPPVAAESHEPVTDISALRRPTGDRDDVEMLRNTIQGYRLPPPSTAPRRHGVGGGEVSRIGQPRAPEGLDGIGRVDQTLLPSVGLGRGDATLNGSGCVLTSLAMALSRFEGKTINPAELNDFLAEHGAFDGSGLIIQKAASLLGLEASPSIDMHAPGAIDELRRAVAAGEPVMLRVDYEDDVDSDEKKESVPDHTLVVTGMNPDGSFRGIDPAGGYEAVVIVDHGDLVGRGARPFHATSFRSIGQGGTSSEELQ